MNKLISIISAVCLGVSWSMSTPTGTTSWWPPTSTDWNFFSPIMHPVLAVWAAGLLGRALVRQYAATGNARVLKALDTAYAGNREWVKLGWAGSNPWPAFAPHGWTGNPKIAEALTAFYNELGDEKKNSS